MSGTLRGLACLALLACGVTHAAAPRPYRVAIAVGFGERRGPESLREEIATELRASVSKARCFEEIAGVTDAPGARDLVLDVRLDDLSEALRHETTLGEQAAATDPAVERQVVAEVTVLLTVAIRVADVGEVARERRSTVGASHRPIVEEDPREIARAELVREIVRRATSFACSGSASRLVRDIARARERSAAR